VLLNIAAYNLMCIIHLFNPGSGEEAVSDQNINFEGIENDRFENMFEMANMSQMLNVLGNGLW